MSARNARGPLWVNALMLFFLATALSGCSGGSSSLLSGLNGQSATTDGAVQVDLSFPAAKTGNKLQVSFAQTSLVRVHVYVQGTRTEVMPAVDASRPAGATSMTVPISGLAPGLYDLFVECFDAQGNSAGYAFPSAQVLARQTTVVAVSQTVQPISLAVTPATATLAVGATQALSVVATFANGVTAPLSEVITWSSGNAAVATVSTSGVATGVASGAATITATLGGLSANAALTVGGGGGLVSVTVTPGATTLGKGLLRAYTAIGNYGDGTSVDLTNMVTWSSDNVANATVSDTAGTKGVVQGVAVGVTTVTADAGNGITGSTTVTVNRVPMAFDSYVRAITCNAAGTTYLGGTFTRVGPFTGAGVALDPTSALPYADAIANGHVYTSQPDGQGGWYIGGAFTALSGVTRNHLAHILRDGSVDPAWNPGADGNVNAIAIDPISATIYVGGTFTTVGGQARANVAAIDDNGTVLAWNPGADASVSRLAVHPANGTVFLGGTFTQVGGQARTRIAAVDATGTVTAWNPAPNGTVVSALALSAAGDIVYAGGDFSNIGGQARSNAAAIDGAGLATAWNPSPDASVNAIAVNPTSGTVYLAGAFLNVSATARGGAAAVDAAGALTAWDPALSIGGFLPATVLSVGVDAQTGNVYMGGDFDTAGAQSRGRVVAVDATGALLPWNPGVAGDVLTFSFIPGGSVYVGGRFVMIGGQVRNRIAALDVNGDLTAWNPNANAEVSAIGLDPTSGTVYAGGYFDAVGGQTRNYLAAIDPTTGVPTAWNPNLDNTVNAIGVRPADGVVFAGGSFTLVGATTRNHLAAIDPTTGAATAWNPNVNNDVYALALDVANTQIYAGGSFTQVGASTRNRIAAINTTTGAATAWNPNGSGGFSPGVNAIAFGATGPVYVGGEFTTIGGQTRNNVAAIDAATGLATAWNPNSDAFITELALDAVGGRVYATGDFTQVGGQPRNTLAAINTADGLAAAWNPAPNGAARTLSIHPTTGSILVGGLDFTQIGGQYRANFATLDPGTGNALGAARVMRVLAWMRDALWPFATASGHSS